MKIFTVADVRNELVNDWLQHLRDFDAAHPGCHFEVLAEAPEMSLMQMIEVLRVNPDLPITEVFKRKGN